MDTKLRQQIVFEVREAFKQQAEQANEVWLSGEELIKRFQMFTKSWLKTYGSTLPRTQAVVTTADGQAHATGWCYPMHKIQRMISEGTIKNLRL